MNALLALAFGAGLLAPVNPCGFAVLPAFIAYAIGADTDTATSTGRCVATRLAGGLRAGIALTLGFAGTFTLIGLLLAIGMRSLIGVVPWAAALLGGILAVGGIAMLLGRPIPLRLPTRRAGPPRQGPPGMIAFGSGYALASASCTLALLLSVLTQALASTNLSGVLTVFAAYAAGSATLLLCPPRPGPSRACAAARPAHGRSVLQRQVQRKSGGEVDLRAPKYGSERTIYLADALVEIVAAHVARLPGHGANRWLFRGENGNPPHQNTGGVRPGGTAATRRSNCTASGTSTPRD